VRSVQGVRPVQRAHQRLRLRTPREHQELRCRYKKRRKQTPQKKLARQSKHSASEVTQPAALHERNSSRISSRTLSIELKNFLKIRALHSFQMIQCTKMITVSKSRRVCFGALCLALSHHSSVLPKSSLGTGKFAPVQSLNRCQTCLLKRQ
jgi:hypothetical protein